MSAKAIITSRGIPGYHYDKSEVMIAFFAICVVLHGALGRLCFLCRDGGAARERPPS